MKSILAKGKKVFIRTVTHFYTGEVQSVSKEGVVLKSAAWIADTGRFHNFLKDGTVNEVEPFVSPVFVPFTAMIDATPWLHELPKAQK